MKFTIVIIFSFFSSFCCLGQNNTNPNGPLTTSWHQTGVYNDKAPLCGTEQTPIGCGAIAVGQILEYYNYPNFNITYQAWELQNCFDSGLTGFQIVESKNIFSNGIDDFLYDVATILITEFSEDGSTVYFNTSGTAVPYLEYAFETLLKYESSITSISDNIGNAAFSQAIINELTNCRPVLLLAQSKFPSTKAGHWMVIDDYDPSAPSKKFHINMGWKDDTFNTWYDLNIIEAGNYKFKHDRIAIVGIIPDNVSDACSYVTANDDSNENNKNLKSNNDETQNKSLIVCPTILYPPSTNISNNLIQVSWEDSPSVFKNFIEINDLTNNQTIVSYQETYAGQAAYNSSLYYQPNIDIEILIETFDLNGNLLNSCSNLYTTSSLSCNLEINYQNAVCIESGDQYIIELNFNGENAPHDLYASWDGIVYDSKDGVYPGFYVLGPFDTSQYIGIVVESESDPFNCYNNNLVFPDNSNINCIPDPTNSGGNGGGSIACDIPTGLSHSISGTTVTFTWDAMANSTSYTVCESNDGITDSACYVITSNSQSISGYSPCNTYYWRVRNNCAPDESVYTPYQPFTVSNGSGGSCNVPSNVQVSENSTSMIVTWNVPNSGASPSDYLLRYSELGTNNWNTTHTNGGQSLFISNLQACTDYEVQIKSVCGCSESGWTTAVTAATGGCSAPTCSDGIMNGTETGVDCGGNCPSCSPGVCDDFMITNPNPNNCNTQFALVTSTKNIIWSPGGCGSGLVDIEYSVNGGNTWISQITNTPDDGIYAMTFTNAHASSQFRLKVSCTTGNDCAETCNYSINGTNTLGCTNSAAHNYNASANQDDGSCETCVDGIQNGDETGVDCGGSNSNCPPCNLDIEITNPVCGELFHSNCVGGGAVSMDIQWNLGSNSCNNVNIYYSVDDGNSYETLVLNALNDGYHTVSVFDDVSDNFIVKVESSCNASNFDISCPFIVSTGPNTVSNSDPCNAIVLSTNSTCTYSTYNNCGAFNSTVPTPTCSNYDGGDVWFKALVNSDGNIGIKATSIEVLLDGFFVYTGACGNLYYLACDDDVNNNPEKELSGLVPNSYIYIRYFSNSFAGVGDFDICVYDPIVCSGDIIAWPIDVSIECESDASDLSIVGDVLGETTLCPTCNEATYVDNNNYVACTGGLITRQWTFVDECNVTYTHNQIIYITGDQTPPVFTDPADIVLNCNQDFTNLNLTGNVSGISDYCSGSTTVTFTDDVSNLDYCTNTGYVIRFWVAEDDCSNKITKVQFIHLINNNCEAIRCEGESCYTAEEITSFNTLMYCDGPSFGGSATASDATHADWFYFDAPYDGEIDVYSCLGGVDTRLFIWEGNCSNLIALANNDDNCLMSTGGSLAWASELIGVQVQAGQRYYIEWDSKWSENPFNWYFRFYGCNDVVTSFPAIMEFDNGLENFLNDPEGVLDWSFISGPTPSVGTGSADTYSMSDYIYVEASGNNVGYPNKLATIISPCYDLSNLTNPELSFAYNMEGSAMGSLGVLVSDDLGRSWTVKFNKSGDQGPGWHKETIDLSAFANSEIKIMFEGWTGTGYQSDICIDQVIVKEKCVSSCSNTISNYSYTNQFVSGIGDFEQQSSCDDLNWTHNTGATSSGNTGPSAGFINPGYMYLESSGNNVPYKMAVIESPCFNVSSLNLPTITFRYHMYGLDMGFFELEISDDNGATWDQLLVRNGDYGDNWFSYFNNDLSGYGNTIKFRITGITGGSYRSDMAFDYFWIYETCPDNYTFTGNQNFSSLYEAKFNITSSRSVNIPVLKYDAGQSIDLLPGFEVSLGTQFDAYIDGCGDNGNEQFAPSDSVSNSLKSEPKITNEKN